MEKKTAIQEFIEKYGWLSAILRGYDAEKKVFKFHASTKQLGSDYISYKEKNITYVDIEVQADGSPSIYGFITIKEYIAEGGIITDIYLNSQSIETL